jgi:hypothetical protein
MGSETVVRYQIDIMGTRETQGVLLDEVYDIKPIDGKILQTMLWELDPLIVSRKQGNVSGGNGLAGESLEEGHIFRINRRVKDGNKTGPITYLECGREVLLKSRMRENLTSGSVRWPIEASGQNNPKRRRL